MQELFEAREQDPDTYIYSEKYHEFDGIPVLFEHWGCDGISGTSLVVPKQFLPETDEISVVSLLKKHFEFDSYTFSAKPNSNFVFVNMGFYRQSD